MLTGLPAYFHSVEISFSPASHVECEAEINPEFQTDQLVLTLKENNYSPELLKMRIGYHFQHFILHIISIFVVLLKYENRKRLFPF